MIFMVVSGLSKKLLENIERATGLTSRKIRELDVGEISRRIRHYTDGKPKIVYLDDYYTLRK